MEKAWKSWGKFHQIHWMMRAKRQKVRWFSAAFKGKVIRKPGAWGQVVRWAVGSAVSFCLWAGLGLLMLVLSCGLFWRLGEASLSDYPLSSPWEESKEEQGISEKEEQRISEKEEQRIRKEEQGISEKEERRGEVFGLEIRIQDGKIVFFREKEEQRKGALFIR